MTGREVLEKIVEAERELDRFNLLIAEWRVGHGIGDVLPLLYKKMGEVSAVLKLAKRSADFSDYISKL